MGGIERRSPAIERTLADQSKKTSTADKSSDRSTSDKRRSTRSKKTSSTRDDGGKDAGKSTTKSGVPKDTIFEIIDTVEGVEALAKKLMKEDVVAFDTEADSFYHYFDKVCLVQVATRTECWLVDPLAIGGPDKLEALAKVFSSTKVRVLFHAAEYDIYVLKRDCGFEFTNLFDTMVSAQLLGYPAIGLAALVEKHFGVSLPKDEQRSDWSRRPLTPKQQSYAASDVLYLIQLAEKLEKELTKAKRLDWAQDEFATLCGRRWPDREFDELGYLRIKGARSLDSVELAILRELFLLRDVRARDIDRPPFKVLGNRTLLEISNSQPTDLDSLAEIKGITDLILKRLGKDLVSAVKKGLRKPHGPIPKLETSGRRRMDRTTERRLGALKDWRGPRAESLKLDPGVLCPNAALEAIAWAAPTNAKDLKGLPELKDWFVREFADEIVGIIERHDAEVAEAAEKEEGEKSEKPKRNRRGGRGRSGAARKKRARRARKKADGGEGSPEKTTTTRASSESRSTKTRAKSDS